MGLPSEYPDPQLVIPWATHEVGKVSERSTLGALHLCSLLNQQETWTDWNEHVPADQSWFVNFAEGTITTAHISYEKAIIL